MLSNKRLSSLKPFMFTAYYDWMLENEITPHLMVDANMPGVKVPAEYVKDGCIILSISPTAISDYQCLKSGISFKARFRGQTEDIFVPYLAMSQLVALESGAALPIGRALEQLELGEEEELTPDEGIKAEENLFSLDDSDDDSSADDYNGESVFDDDDDADADGQQSFIQEITDDLDLGDEDESSDSKEAAKPGFEFVE